VAAGVQEFAEARRGFRDCIRRSDADDVEAFAFAVGDEIRLRLGDVRDQKSRSA
jgi:hypothetical protein